MHTAQHIINGVARTFDLTQQPAVSLALEIDMKARGWDGTVWFGVAPKEGKRRERQGLFYRTESGQFVFVS